MRCWRSNVYSCLEIASKQYDHSEKSQSILDKGLCVCVCVCVCDVHAEMGGAEHRSDKW